MIQFASGWPVTNNQYDNTGWRMWLQLRPINRRNKIKRLFNDSK